MKKKMLIFAVLLVLAFIFLQSTVPEQRSDNESIWFNARIMTPLLKRMGYSAVSGNVVRKAAHISEFFVLSLFAALIWKGRIIPSFYTGFTAAFLDESVQVIAQRGALITDVWIDLIGVALGVLFGWMIFKAYDGMRRKMIKRKGVKAYECQENQL